MARRTTGGEGGGKMYPGGKGGGGMGGGGGERGGGGDRGTCGHGGLGGAPEPLVGQVPAMVTATVPLHVLSLKHLC